MDQYNRGVGIVRYRSLFGWYSYVDEQMIAKGYAEVYTGTGAVYGRYGTVDKYLQIQEKAQKQRLGIWSDKNRESAQQYKARIKQQ